MPDYVYALHDFVPEHDDELTFKAGERIEVIERDDEYQDGWWQGKSLSGKVGLFPRDFTTPSTAGFVEARSLTAAVAPMQSVEEEPDGAVMQATLSDVQEAIEQLGVNGDADASRSFSFASSHGDVTDRELDDENDSELDPEAWHRGARQLLARNAQLEMERRRSAEAAVAARPPITVELSDESEPDDDDDYQHTRHRKQSSIDTMTTALGSSSAPVHQQTVPEEDEEEHAAAASSSITKANGDKVSRPASTASLPTPTSPQSLLPQPQEPVLLSPVPETASTFTGGNYIVPSPSITRGADEAHSLPSPAPSSVGGKAAQVPLPRSPPVPEQPSPMFRSMSPNVGAMLMSPESSRATAVAPKKPRGHPSEWSVDEVVEWLRGKGFDDSICEKFIEHEISGDVLVDLDANSLKELEIHAFGKRKKIENAIIELRRPPSVNSSAESMRHSSQMGHAKQASFSNSNNYSLNSPKMPISAGVMSIESPPHTGDLMATPMSERDRSRMSDPLQTNNLIGLGITEPTDRVGKNKSKPAQLVLSPSEGQLRKRALRGGSTDFIPEEREETDKGALSETETAPSRNNNDTRSSRRRVFGRSIDSSSSRGGSSPRDSKEISTAATSLPGSPLVVTVNKRPSTGSKDGRKPDRSSFFAGTIGKSRKTSARTSASSVNSDDGERERAHTGFGRLLNPGSKKGSGRPTTPGNAKDLKDPSKEKEERLVLASSHSNSSGTLKKRSIAPSEVKLEPSRSNLKADKADRTSILEQIGTPDHAGYLRKKGERYNTWKLRYLVLKGPHLYYLRSDHKSETKIKGYIDITGYKILADENVNPGRYGFRIIHDTERAHYFSYEEQIAVREWMKALMKATIGRDYTKPVVSSVNIPTIPLAVAQAMNPAPRPPSPTARDATQRALRRENPQQLSTRDAQILMGLPSEASGARETFPDRADVESLFSASKTPVTPAPPRPVRDNRASRTPTVKSGKANPEAHLQSDPELLSWANRHLPPHLQLTPNEPVASYGLSLLRLAEDIKGSPCDPPVPDHAFPTSMNDERLDGLFKLFDMLLDEGVKIGAVSINDVRQGNGEKIQQLLRAMRAWEDKLRMNSAAARYNNPTVTSWMSVS